MKGNNNLLLVLLFFIMFCGAWLPIKLEVQAEEIEVPGYYQYSDSEGESIVYWYAIPRGTYLKDGICGIRDAGKGKVTVSTTTTAHRVSDTVRASVYLDESSDGGRTFSQIGSYYFSENNTGTCHGSKANISVTSGWWYMARGGHSVTNGSTTETMSTSTSVIKSS